MSLLLLYPRSARLKVVSVSRAVRSRRIFLRRIPAFQHLPVRPAKCGRGVAYLRRVPLCGRRRDTCRRKLLACSLLTHCGITTAAHKSRLKGSLWLRNVCLTCSSRQLTTIQRMRSQGTIKAKWWHFFSTLHIHIYIHTTALLFAMWVNFYTWKLVKK